MSRSTRLTNHNPGQHFTLNIWPPLLDLVASALMVFVLVGLLQTVFNLVDAKSLEALSKQLRFMQLFEEEFRSEIARGTIAARRNLNFIQITFSDRILFDSTRHELHPAGETMLRRCARLLCASSNTGFEQIQVEGHTDNVPLERSTYPRNNWELSTARALAVVEYLTTVSHMDERVFSANGYAQHQPVASNATDEGKARNRRIELRLFFSVDKPQSSLDEG